jgi:uracil-DNA glycosylase
MADTPRTAAPFVPTTSVRALRAAPPGCRGCDLYNRATQVVFGDGPPSARLVVVGERVLPSIHPSADLRAPDAEARREAFEGLVETEDTVLHGGTDPTETHGGQSALEGSS